MIIKEQAMAYYNNLTSKNMGSTLAKNFLSKGEQGQENVSS
ncbi:hypothetical protein HMPREF9151_01106 [Hoylesella saccharolytica F0055]|uniref:Uncharacterized protein n=1 Tax=Hoylesella saccharolytica F0055 TaxID=1127699 RepID=L1ND39_9BACT|nr:hypothetical protein HMPREF9151_01106 [Hoylesella saccharolytica F0055]